MKPPKIKTPNFRRATIGEVLTWAASVNGIVKGPRKQKVVTEALANISQLSRIASMSWFGRKWALKALESIDKIGVTEKLKLFDHKLRNEPGRTYERDFGELPTGLNRMGIVAEVLGLTVLKISKRVVITPLKKASDVRMVSDLPPEERGLSSPLLPLG